MAEVGSVEVPLKLKGAAAFQKGIDGAGAAMGGLAHSTTGAGNALLGFAAAAAGITALASSMVAGLKKVSAAGAAVEAGLAGIAGVYQIKKTSAEYDQLAQAAKRAGIETQFSPAEAIEGLTSMATAGLNAQAATTALLPVLDLAASSMGQLGVAGAADAVVGTMKSYGMQMSEAGAVTDKLVKVTQLTNFQMKDFGVALSKVAAVGGSFNQSLDDMVIGVGLIRDKNIDASIAASALSTATLNLAGNQQKQAVLAKAGVRVHDQQTGKLRSMLDIISDVSVATENMTTKERDAMLVKAFGVRGILAYTAISKAQVDVLREGEMVTLKGAEAIKHLRKEMGNAEGTAEAFKNTLLDTFEGQMTLLAGSTETLMSEIGLVVNESLRPMVEGVKNVVNEVLDFINRMSPELKAIAGKMMVWGTVGATAVAGITLAVGGLVLALGVLPSVLAAAKAGMVVFGAVASASIWPVTAIVAGLLVLAANLRLLWGQEIPESFKDTGAEIKRQTSNWRVWLIDALTKPFQFMLFIANEVLGVVQKGVYKIMELAQSAVLQIAEAGRAAFKALGQDTSFWDKEIAGIAKARKHFREYKLDLLKMAKEGIKQATGGLSTAEFLAEIFDPFGEGAQEVIGTSLKGTMKGMGWLVEDALSGLGIDTGKDLFGLKDLIPGADAATQQLEKAMAELGTKFDKMGETAKKTDQSLSKLPDMGDKWRSFLARGGGLGPARSFTPGGPKITMPGEGPQAKLDKSQKFAEEKAAIAAEKRAETMKKVTDGLKSFGAGISKAISIIKEFAGPKFAGAMEILTKQIITSLGPVFDTFAPILILFAAIIKSLNPILQELTRLFHNISYELFYFFRDLQTGFLRLVAELADFFGFDDFAAELREAANDLAEQNFGDAVDAAAAAARELANAAEEAAESMLNVPSGYKVTRARHGAIMDDFVMRPGQPAVEFSPDDTLVGVKDTSDIGGGRSIVIHNVSIAANDPSTFFRRLMEMVEGDNLRGGVNLGGNWQGRP